MKKVVCAKIRTEIDEVKKLSRNLIYTNFPKLSCSPVRSQSNNFTTTIVLCTISTQACRVLVVGKRTKLENESTESFPIKSKYSSLELFRKFSCLSVDRPVNKVSSLVRC